MNGLVGKQLSIRRLLCSVAAVTASVSALTAGGEAAVARAGIIDLGACNSAALSQPFAPWADFDFYELAPGGDFATSSWRLSAGAKLISDSGPSGAAASSDAQSLLLPAGAAALSPSTCVDAAYPTVRLFVGGNGSVAVYLVTHGVRIPVGLAAGDGAWEPSLPMSSDAAVVAAAAGGTGRVSIELVGLTGRPLIDDVYIDPMFRGN
jgi:hypothetical protein